jgi:hypothetical protein
MTSGEFIQGKLQAWARRKGIALQGSAGERGSKNYTKSLGENLFGGELRPEARAAFEAGAGGELRHDIPSMQALHSSAAMAVNLFQHWIGNRDLSTLAKLLDVPSGGIEAVGFERKYPVCADWKDGGFNAPPHLDLGVDYKNGGRVGVECKLFEPYGRLQHAPLKSPYLALKDAWKGIPACRALAEELSKNDAGFRRLGPAQLLRHVLGLRFGAPVEKVRLVYLYYDAPGDEAAEHRAEIRGFQDRIGKDPIRFVPITVQEFAVRAVRECREDHRDYVDYLAERYL